MGGRLSHHEGMSGWDFLFQFLPWPPVLVDHIF